MDVTRLSADAPRQGAALQGCPRTYREKAGSQHPLLQRAGRDVALLSVKLLKHATLKIYPGFSYGMLTINADVINHDLGDLPRP